MVVIRIPITRRSFYASIVVVGALMLIAPAVGWAADRFDDVPDSSIFHDDISWLADSGVTRGCNPPENSEFCPNDVVRRDTMAAFLHRLATSQVVDAKSAITSQTAGFASTSGDAPIAAAASGVGIYTEDWNWDDPHGKTEVIAVSLDVPSDGLVLATGFATVRHGHGTGTRDRYVVDITDDFDGFDPAFGATIHDAASFPNGDIYGTVTPHRVFEVTKGMHTFTLVAANLDKVLEADVRDVALSAVFYPDVDH